MKDIEGLFFKSTASSPFVGGGGVATRGRDSGDYRDKMDLWLFS
jgi:hypothetical protein